MYNVETILEEVSFDTEVSCSEIKDDNMYMITGGYLEITAYELPSDKIEELTKTKTFKLYPGSSFYSVKHAHKKELLGEMVYTNILGHCLILINAVTDESLISGNKFNGTVLLKKLSSEMANAQIHNWEDIKYNSDESLTLIDKLCNAEGTEVNGVLFLRGKAIVKHPSGGDMYMEIVNTTELSMIPVISLFKRVTNGEPILIASVRIPNLEYTQTYSASDLWSLLLLNKHYKSPSISSYGTDLETIKAISTLPTLETQKRLERWFVNCSAETLVSLKVETPIELGIKLMENVGTLEFAKRLTTSPNGFTEQEYHDIVMMNSKLQKWSK